MKNVGALRKSYMIKSFIKETFRSHAKLIAFIFIAIIFAIVLGISIVCKNSYAITIQNCLDKTLVKCLCNNAGLSGFFVKKLFEFVLACVLIFACFSVKFLFPFVPLIFSFYIFKIVFDVTIICTLLGFHGFLFCLIVLIPFAVLVVILLSFFCCGVSDSIFCRDRNAFNNCLKLFLIIFAIYIVLTLLQLLLFSIFSPILIIIV